MSANIVKITEHFGLTADDTQYTLYEMVTVDPAKAPGYKAPADGTMPPTRTEWRSAQRFYSLTADGLAAAIQTAAIREVNRKSVAADITELLAEYKAEVTRIGNAITDALAVTKPAI